MNQIINQSIKDFWDRNPLLSGELSEKPGSTQFFIEFDRIKLDDIFLGDLSFWMLPQMRNKLVLDVGCGPGFWCRRLNEVGAKYHGIDISTASIDLTRQSMSQFGHFGELHEANAEQIPYPDNYFDFVVSEGVIHHAHDTDQCIREIYRVLKPSGRFIISVYYRNLLLRSSMMFALARYAMKLTKYGLRGRGRENMHNANTVEEFVRSYDGAENPIGRCYSSLEFLNMLSSFQHCNSKAYYFPRRALSIPPPKWLIRLALPAIGTMLAVSGIK